MKKIKKKCTSKEKIKVPKEDTILRIGYPVFCFRHLNFNPKGDNKFYVDFITRLTKLCNFSWDEINKSAKHSFGTEKIPVKQIKPQLPAFLTPDVESLTVFRANGDNRPFLGIRKGDIFHIIFIEEKFGDIYQH